MARPKKIIAVVEAAPEPPSLGNLSEEDLKAIRGEGVTATEMLTSGAPGSELVDFPDVPFKPGGSVEFAPDSFMDSITGRLLTLEGRMTDLERAMEGLAQHMSRVPEQSSSITAQLPTPTRPATKEEEAAYCRINHERRGTGEQQFDGIEAWRAAGSPGLAR
jgi:hypothetical protein